MEDISTKDIIKTTLNLINLNAFHNRNLIKYQRNIVPNVELINLITNKVNNTYQEYIKYQELLKIRYNSLSEENKLKLENILKIYGIFELVMI